MKRFLAGGLCAVVLFGTFIHADEPAKAAPKVDLTEFSKLVQGLVVKQMPKEVKDDSGWGQTIPIPPNLSLPNLRSYIKVGDKVELPHGFWRKVKLTMPEEAPPGFTIFQVSKGSPLTGNTPELVSNALMLARA